MNNIRKVAAIVSLLFLIVTNAGAVLKEKDLAQTLRVLRLELDQAYHEQKSFMLKYEQQSAEQHGQLVNYMKRCEQIGLMLYSQKEDFTFDVAYASTEAANLYKQLHKNNVPYDRIKTRISTEVARYDSLIIWLKELPPSVNTNSTTTVTDSINMLIDADEEEGFSYHSKPFILTAEEQDDRELCLKYALALKKNLVKMLKSIDEDQQYYTLVSDKVGKLNDYAKHKYKDIQRDMFKDMGNNYFSLLRNLPQQLQHAMKDYNDQYRSFGEGERHRSEWRGPVVLTVSVFMLFYIFVAVLLSNIIIRLIPKLTKRFFPKFAHRIEIKLLRDKLNFNYDAYRLQRKIIIVAVGIFIFTMVITVVSQVIRFNPFIMAAKLMIDFSWLIEAILISLLVRLKPEQAGRGVAIYMPFIWMALVIIFFRIVLIPNNIVNLICPPLLLTFTVWQYSTVIKNKNYLPFIDLVYSAISLVVLVVSCICSWLGYTLMAVLIIIWWTFLLAAVETINCCYDILAMYKRRFLVTNIIRGEDTISGKIRLIEQRNDGTLYLHMSQGKYIHKTWIFDLVEKTIIPMATIAAVAASFYWAAGIFEMTAACTEMFTKLIIDEPKYIQLSLAKLSMVIAFYFLFKYINYVTHAIYVMFRLKKAQERGGDFNDTLAKNIIAIIVWGIYVAVSLIMLKVPQTGISVVMAGLATGMGFAMKDLLENFFYGISLMSGRVRVGEYIECDGIQGKVESITYQSTQVVTMDGSIIAFLNSSLFSKNFKNLTRNNGYILVKIPVGVAYGTDIARTRQLIIEAVRPYCSRTVNGIDVVDNNKGIGVLVDEFGDNSVNLLVTAWVLFDQKRDFTTRSMESIYQSFNRNGVEIPFPQRDIHIRSVVDKA